MLEIYLGREKTLEHIISIENLSKSFGDIKAVRKIFFHVDKGEFFAFLGINGAGKSTTISIMCGSLKKDEGQVFIDGKNIDTDLESITEEIGVVFQSSVLDGVLSVKDNLISRASLYGMSKEQTDKRIQELAKLLNFEDLLQRPVGKLSGGQRRRIDVARALIHNPKILILDEPTTGLDPQTRKVLWNVINGLRKKEKMTVFLTTHYMEETTEADYVVILDKGKITAEGTPIDLKNKYTGDFIYVYNVKEEDVKKCKCEYEKIRDYYKISVKNTQEARDLIIKYPQVFVDFEILKGKMDDVFLAVTGKKLGED